MSSIRKATTAEAARLLEGGVPQYVVDRVLLSGDTPTSLVDALRNAAAVIRQDLNQVAYCQDRIAAAAILEGALSSAEAYMWVRSVVEHQHEEWYSTEYITNELVEAAGELLARQEGDEFFQAMKLPRPIIRRRGVTQWLVYCSILDHYLLQVGPQPVIQKLPREKYEVAAKLIETR